MRTVVPPDSPVSPCPHHLCLLRILPHGLTRETERAAREAEAANADTADSARFETENLGDDDDDFGMNAMGFGG